jgi:hypothetical protein
MRESASRFLVLDAHAVFVGPRCQRKETTQSCRKDQHGFRQNDLPRTRTWNLRLRRPTPYPLGQQTFWLWPRPAFTLLSGISIWEHDQRKTAQKSVHCCSWLAGVLRPAWWQQRENCRAFHSKAAAHIHAVGKRAQATGQEQADMERDSQKVGERQGKSPMWQQRSWKAGRRQQGMAQPLRV